MMSRVCICCGEPMPGKATPLSRNPNLCISCAGLAEEMEGAEGPQAIHLEYPQPRADERAAEDREAA
jgi:hypothetical protein